jgi:transposase-like protein
LPARNSRIALWVQRAIAEAQHGGMSYADIAAATEVNPSTWHRWRTGETEPQLPALRSFCDGLGLDFAQALDALRQPAPRRAAEPPMDPDVLKILRRLADPDYPAEMKKKIKVMLRNLAELADASSVPAKAERRRRVG